MRDLSSVKRVVVKVGTNMLTGCNGIDLTKIDDIASQIAELKNRGYQVLLVSSGAVGMGAKELSHNSKVVHIPLRQACAAIGQPLLMSAYRSAFAKYELLCAQILLTRNDLNNRRTYNNLRASVSTLLAMGVVPIFNENDTVSTAEIGTAFGDNDRMSAMVASKIDADLLLLLTDISGLYTGNPKTDKNAKMVYDIEEIDDTVMSWAKGAGSTFSTGGMKTKLLAAKIAAQANCGTIIASGYEKNVMIRIISGEELGSFIHPLEKLTQRERWILNNSHQGSITVDGGAKKALLSHKSLLPKGIRAVDGIFEAGDVVQLIDEDGVTFAKAVPYYNSTDISKLMGHESQEIPALLGEGRKDCVFRPEDMVVLDNGQSI
jgi:glutamate 5-kinase